MPSWHVSSTIAVVPELEVDTTVCVFKVFTWCVGTEALLWGQQYGPRSHTASFAGVESGTKAWFISVYNVSNYIAVQVICSVSFIIIAPEVYITTSFIMIKFTQLYVYTSKYRTIGMQEQSAEKSNALLICSKKKTKVAQSILYMIDYLQ